MSNSRIEYRVRTWDDVDDSDSSSMFDTEDQAKEFTSWFEFVNDLVIEHGLHGIVNTQDHKGLANLYDKRHAMKAFFDALAEYDGHLFTFKLKNPKGFNMGEWIEAENEYERRKELKD